ncbi:MAG: type IV pilus assembly protein PilM [Nitrospinae bacterium]|nr:type IV pilus assembly protein PilM [Nitrospinota bacterium]
MFFSSQKPLLAVDIGTHSLKVAQIKKNRAGYELLSFGCVNLPPDSVVDGEIENPKALADALSNLIKSEKIKCKDAVIGVSGQSVVIKKISVPMMPEEELEEMIREEAEQYIPFDIDEVNLDFQIVGGDAMAEPSSSGPDERQMDVIIVAVQKTIIQSFLDIFKSVGLKVRVVDLSVFALENIFELSHGPALDSAIALVNIGATMTNINILERGTTAFARDLPMGASVISEEIQKGLSIGFGEAEKMKLGEIPDGRTKEEVIKNVLGGVEEICIEFRKTFDMFEKNSDIKISKIYLSGGGAMMDGMDRLVGDQLGISTEMINPFDKITFSDKRFDPQYLEAMAPSAVVSLGLALRTTEDK